MDKIKKPRQAKPAKFYRFRFHEPGGEWGNKNGVVRDIIVKAPDVLTAGKKVIKENSDLVSRDPRFILRFLVGMAVDHGELAALEVK